jgi:dTDP-4-dehydrorhamnose 3,5-epimerase
MHIESLGLQGLLLIRLQVYRDERGFFVERFQAHRFREQGLPTNFVQDNHSRSAPGVLRGLHYQNDPAQGKLVGVIRGRIWDVAVDIRVGSPTFGQSVGIELSDTNGLLLWVPPGFAHGFCVLGNEAADLLYKVDAPYNAAGEGGLHWADPDLAIAWPVSNPVVSAKDERLTSFAHYRAQPAFSDLDGLRRSDFLTPTDAPQAQPDSRTPYAST